MVLSRIQYFKVAKFNMIETWQPCTPSRTVTHVSTAKEGSLFVSAQVLKWLAFAHRNRGGMFERLDGDKKVFPSGVLQRLFFL